MAVDTDEAPADGISRAFQALGDPVRVRIVDHLSTTDATVGELVALFPISFQAVSQHLGVLERAGVISRQREGRHRRVRLEPARLDAAADWMDARRRRLEERYRRLDELLAETAPHTPTTHSPDEE